VQNSRVITGAIIAALIPLSGNAALAHAQLRHATPAPGGTVATLPSEVLVNFSEPLEAAFSSVVVHDPVGKRVDKADAHLRVTACRSPSPTSREPPKSQQTFYSLAIEKGRVAAERG